MIELTIFLVIAFFILIFSMIFYPHRLLYTTCIFFILASVVGFHYYQSLKGFANNVQTDLYEKFFILHYVIDDKNKVIYLLILDEKTQVPRLYAITSNFLELKRKLEEAEAKRGKTGVPLVGRPKNNYKNYDGHLEFDLDVELLKPFEQIPKQP